MIRSGFWVLIVSIAIVVFAGCSDENGETPTDDIGVDASADIGQQDANGESGPDAGADADIDSDTDTGNGEEGRPSGEVAEVVMGDALDVDEARADAARDVFEELDKSDLEEGFSPAELYEVFNEFALTHFGVANQPLVEEFTGDLLDFKPDGDWTHISKNSASVAFETTLPVRGYIEYGTDEEALDESTEESERYFFNQLHHLSDLEAETTYYYRLVARGDDGETIISHTRSFTTEDGSDWTAVPGDLDGPPYRLDDSSTTYYLSEDLSAPRTALVVEGTDITVDLNGHTVVYGDDELGGVDENDAEESASGIWGRTGELSDIRIVNGQLSEGHVGNQSTSNGGLNPIYLSGVDDIEIAGVSMDYHAAQIHALFLRYPSGRVHLHHNRFTDRGFEILDRHGSGGGRPLRIIASDPDEGEMDDFELNHNLVARTRQNGLMRAPLMRNNEVFVDSWSTNSFAMQSFSREGFDAGTMSENKIFLTGYNAYGFGWAHQGYFVEGNLVQMEGVSSDDRRYYENWGEMDAMAAFRITNYGDGGQPREDLTYRDNVVVGRARGEGIMRGTMFYTDESIENTTFERNFVHVGAADDVAIEATPVVGQGVYANRDDHLPAYYVDNRLVSNVANVRFGDDYGRGDRHTFVDTTFVRDGDHPDYHTFVFDAGFDSNRHQVINPTFEGGASYDDVWWRRTSVFSYYSVGWSLDISGEADASVVINDVDGEEVFSGELDEDGELSVPLIALTIRPAEWEPGTDGFEVQERFSHQEIEHTPHEVIVGGESETVEMDERTAIEF